ncbi:hypothetical protein [Candidatus Cyanaurora vandensis]|uniref:hypothetical protein n=1 Tax=Candidatus Cyanaurora vandensis TaxID=2714958 RepID=UPI00257F9F98|nr:hypothetical protein [Candidatus Cyanaurora vandensis]
MYAALDQFRRRHPLGGVLTELLRVEQGLYVVRAEVQVDKMSLGSGLAAADSLEHAEDQAVGRALLLAGFGEAQAPLAAVEEPARRNGTPTPIYTAPEEAPRRNGTPPPVYENEDDETFLDLSELIAATDVELKRIGWENAQGKAYLSRTYGKPTRRQLNEEELRDFLRHLKTQPTAMTRRAPETPF